MKEMDYMEQGNNNSFINQGHLQLIKSDSKDI